MSGRHRADGEPCSIDPRPLLGALAAEPLDNEVARAITELTTGWLHGIAPRRRGRPISGQSSAELQPGSSWRPAGGPPGPGPPVLDPDRVATADRAGAGWLG